MPPRRQRRKVDDDDEMDKAEQNSRWASIIHHNAKAEEEEEELQPRKEIFTFDFSKEHRLLREKEVVRKEEPKVVLTPQQQAELDRRLEKERVEREEKEKVRRERKSEKKKVVQKEKEEERNKREEDQRAAQQLQRMVKSNKSNSDSRKILLTIAILAICLGLLQYQKDIYARLSKFKLNTQVNFYEVLQTSSSASDLQLRNQYKRLVVKYHPDKNPNCHSCKQKFNSVMQAWQVLGNPEKRGHYDQNSGFINQIKSDTVTLTPLNYEWLLADSDHIWVIQAYDSTSQYCHFFAGFWQDFAEKYKGLVKVGRMDVWQQSEMKKYIPFKFQIFPGLYSMYRGTEELCQLDFERPMRSLELCAEGRATQLAAKISDWSEIKQQSRIAVILGGGVKLSGPVKMIHARFQRYISFYMMNDQSSVVAIRGKEGTFDFSSSGSKTIYHKYRQFLEGAVVQQKSSCQVHYECKERGCLLLLQEDAVVPQQKIYSLPIYRIKEHHQFKKEINMIKNMTGMFQKFDLGYYQDGKIELGYFSEISDLSPDNGEVIDLPCHQQSILFKLHQTYSYLQGLIYPQ